MRGAEGSVWEAVLPSEQFDQVRRTMNVSGAVRKSDGVHTRIVSPERAVPHATPAEPTLEDAFLFTMKGGAAGFAAVEKVA
jgi:hypothetical protein